MSIQTLTPMLRTWDLSGSIAFYTQVLGFERESMSEKWGWASLKRDSVAIMFASPNQHLEESAPAFTGSFYFRVDDVDDLWQRLKDRARVCYPLEDFEYGMREFGIYDNNGYLLQFGQPLPPKT